MTLPKIFMERKETLTLLYSHISAKTKKEYILTKGDNNDRDDRALYNRGQMWINREHVVGKVKG